MNAQTQTNEYRETYEYHGNTSVEMTRSELGLIVKRDWILFDTVEEAQAFYYDVCSDPIVH